MAVGSCSIMPRMAPLEGAKPCCTLCSCTQLCRRQLSLNFSARRQAARSHAVTGSAPHRRFSSAALVSHHEASLATKASCVSPPLSLSDARSQKHAATEVCPPAATTSARHVASKARRPRESDALFLIRFIACCVAFSSAFSLNNSGDSIVPDRRRLRAGSIAHADCKSKTQNRNIKTQLLRLKSCSIVCNTLSTIQLAAGSDHRAHLPQRDHLYVFVSDFRFDIRAGYTLTLIPLIHFFSQTRRAGGSTWVWYHWG